MGVRFPRTERFGASVFLFSRFPVNVDRSVTCNKQNRGFGDPIDRFGTRFCTEQTEQLAGWAGGLGSRTAILVCLGWAKSCGLRGIENNTCYAQRKRKYNRSLSGGERDSRQQQTTPRFTKKKKAGRGPVHVTIDENQGTSRPAYGTVCHPSH